MIHFLVKEKFTLDSIKVFHPTKVIRMNKIFSKNRTYEFFLYTKMNRIGFINYSIVTFTNKIKATVFLMSYINAVQIPNDNYDIFENLLKTIELDRKKVKILIEKQKAFNLNKRKLTVLKDYANLIENDKEKAKLYREELKKLDCTIDKVNLRVSRNNFEKNGLKLINTIENLMKIG